MIKVKTNNELKELEELRNKYAFNINNPILNPSQMIKDIELDIYEVDDAVEELVEEHKRDALLDGANEGLIISLERKFCSFGGELLCYDFDEYSDLVLEYGQLWYGETLYHEPMEMGQCHSNTIKVNDETPECPIVVGYALDKSGYWFTHTWSLMQEPEYNRTYVLETTNPSELYFGVVLTKEQTKYFKENFRL